MAKLTKEEKEIERSFARGEWKSVPITVVRRYRRYFEEAVIKSKRINIRLSPMDLGGIQRRAIEEGIPYQTLIASVIHKFVTGRLVERGV